MAFIKVKQRSIRVLTALIIIILCSCVTILLMVLAFVVVILGALYWSVQLLFTLSMITKVRSIAALPDKELSAWPRISVIMPARNEADTLEAALRKRCESEYPDLELIVVNDRSTDKTGEIAERIAATDPRVHVVHIESLPEGWIGKIYAMHVGAQHARGEWLLFSDADVYVKPGTLKRVIAVCEEKRIDHMAVMPDLCPTRFLVDVTLSVFMRQICALGRPWKAEDPKSNDAVGAGAFNLVRRTAYDAIQGFESLRLTVADDVALGRVLKQSGARASALNGRGHVSVYFYRTIQELAKGSERALFTMFGNFSAFKLIFTAILMLILELAPFIALFFIGLPLLQSAGIVLVGFVLTTSLAANFYLGRPWWTALFVPIAIVIMFVCMVRAAVLGKKRGGIIWRGTFYPTEQLRTFRQS